jgi:hypothetical protein
MCRNRFLSIALAQHRSSAVCANDDLTDDLNDDDVFNDDVRPFLGMALGVGILVLAVCQSHFPCRCNR